MVPRCSWQRGPAAICISSRHAYRFAHTNTMTAAVIGPLQKFGDQSAAGDLRTKCAVQAQGKRIRKARLRDRTVAEVLHVED